MAPPLPPLFIVFDAASGNAGSVGESERVQALLQAAHQPHQLQLVRQPGELIQASVRAVQQARETGGAVVVAGDDGALHTVAQAVWNAGVPMGVLPRGACNAFAHAHGVPTRLDDAVAALLSARVEQVPVGMLDDRVFLIDARIGLGTSLAHDLMSVLRGRSLLSLELHAHGQARVARTRTLIIDINDLRAQAPGVREELQPDPDQLVAITLQPLSMLRALWRVVCGTAGRLNRPEGFDAFAFDELTVRTPRKSRNIHIALDGQVCSVPTPLVFRSAPQPLKLLVPVAAR